MCPVHLPSVNPVGPCPTVEGGEMTSSSAAVGAYTVEVLDGGG
jgi:hypothetical protein